MPSENESRMTSIVGVNKFIDSTGSHMDIGNLGRIEPQGSVMLMDDFLGDQINDEWQQSSDGGATFAIVARVNGVVVGTTAVGDNNRLDLAHNLNWQPQLASIFEARVHIDDITTVCAMVGLTDAVSEGASALPYANAAGRNLVAANCVMIGYDTDDATNTGWTGLSGNAAAAGTLHDLTDAPVNSTYNTLRIEIDVTGNASFYVDGVVRGYEALAVAVATPMTPFFGVMNRAAAITRALSVDYAYVAQRRT